MPCRPQSNEPWSVDDCMNVVPQVYPSDVTTAMFLGTLGSQEHDLQIYSIAQWLLLVPKPLLAIQITRRLTNTGNGDGDGYEKIYDT